MGYNGKPIGTDLTIVTVVLQYGVFATHNSNIQEVMLYSRFFGPSKFCIK